MESSFLNLLQVGESIALIHGKNKRSDGEEEENEAKKIIVSHEASASEKCLDGYFDGGAKGVDEKDLKSHCVRILNRPGLYCCLDRWFTGKSSELQCPISMEKIDPNTHPERIAIVYPGLLRFEATALEKWFKESSQWINPVSRERVDFYMVITKAERTQFFRRSWHRETSVTDNENSTAEYNFTGTLHAEGYTIEGQFENFHYENEKAVFDSEMCKETYYDDVYEGQWRQGEKHGKGRYYKTDTKTMYVGDWKNGKKHGKGIMTYDTPFTIYTGDWKNGKRHGRGSMKFKDESEYNGLWEENKRHGKGKYVKKRYTDESYTYGIWENDKFIARWVEKYEYYQYGGVKDPDFIPTSATAILFSDDHYGNT